MSLETIKTALEDIVELNSVKLGVEYCKVLSIDETNNLCTAQSMLSNNIFTNVRLSTLTKIDDVDKGTIIKPAINSHIYVLKINEYDNLALSFSELTNFTTKIGNITIQFDYDEDTGDTTYYIEYKKDNDYTRLELSKDGIKLEKDGVNMKTAFQDLKTALGAMTVPTPSGPSGTPNNITDINSALDDIIGILD